MQESTLYNGEITVQFNEGSHRYSVNGEFKPGVTGILNVINKPLLLGWAAAMAAEDFRDAIARLQAEGGQVTDKWLKSATESAKIGYTKRSDKAKDLGHLVHSGIESYLLNQPYTTGESQANTLIQGFIDWHKSSGFRTLGTEQVVYSRKYDYCGTFDVLFEKDGKILLGDAKTTKRGYNNQAGVYTEYVAQLGGYIIAYEEETGKSVNDGFIINPDKEYGELQFVTLSSLGISVEQAKEAFIYVFNLYNALKPLEFALKKQNTYKKGAWYAKEKIEQT